MSVALCHDSFDHVRKNEMAGHVTRAKEKFAHRVWWGNLKERDRMEDLVLMGRIILEYAWKK